MVRGSLACAVADVLEHVDAGALEHVDAGVLVHMLG